MLFYRVSSYVDDFVTRRDDNVRTHLVCANMRNIEPAAYCDVVPISLLKSVCSVLGFWSLYSLTQAAISRVLMAA